MKLTSGIRKASQQREAGKVIGGKAWDLEKVN